MEEAVSSGRPGWRWIKAEDKEEIFSLLYYLSFSNFSLHDFSNLYYMILSLLYYFNFSNFSLHDFF